MKQHLTATQSQQLALTRQQYQVGATGYLNLLDAERSKQAAVQAASRKLQVGSGDRSQRIRTYNFPQGRITDHRINLTLYRLPEIIAGDLDELVDALTREDQADQLQRLTTT